jgi:small subunit ribosomal protein S20
MPHNKSCAKRLKTSEKARQANRAVRSTIRTSLKLIRNTKEKAVVETEMPRLFSILDKAARKNRAGFNKNRVANYKSKVHKILASLA